MNSIIKLESTEKDSDEWISHLEELQIQKNEFGEKGSITDGDFMIHLLNNLPKDYDVILNELENCLMVTGDNKLTIDAIHEKSNYRHEKIKIKKRNKSKRKGLRSP